MTPQARARQIREAITHWIDLDALEEAIAGAIQAAVEEEREECASLADRAANDSSLQYRESDSLEQERYWGGRRRISKLIATAIRARKP